MNRQENISRAFVELADTLVENFDVIEFLQRMTVRCQELLDVTDAAVFLGHPGSGLYSPAPCDPGPGLQRVLDAALEEGPAVEAFRTARQVLPGAPADRTPPRWPRLDTRIRQAGYAPPSALPMRLRKDSVGALLLLHTDSRSLTPQDLRLAQAFADVATIGLLHARTAGEQEFVNAQLRIALRSRIIIEQAKGVIAARCGVSPDQAFEAMRRHAGHHRILIKKVAMDVVDAGFLPAVPPGRPQTAQDG
ncbi:GAF and ANTAR domain-containing protein [Streptomyces beigongshangae]|uniref:GAF and ANTAR domain-containing protein n=1 Tax=Streptomyces beigongshangae TaxID=2841597 RepID=UPI001C866D9C|nr:GAF and ANTAR domain-containing protein [Streptomyces sp. REN17]